MNLLYLLAFTLLYLSLQALSHKYMIIHANSAGEDRLKAMKDWHFWGNATRIFVVLGAIGMALLTSFVFSWTLIPLIIGIGFIGGYYFSIFLNLIRGQKWNHIGSVKKKDLDYYMFQKGVIGWSTIMTFMAIVAYLIY